MQFQYVISMQQQSAAEVRAEAIAEAQAAAAQARTEAVRAREVQRDVQRQIREQIQQQIHIGEGQGIGIGQGPGGGPVIMVPPPRQNDIPPHVMEVITIFVVAAVICIVGLPIARAIGRWIDRRGLPSPVNAEMAAQMNRIEQAVDTMSVEVERISEAQRYQAKLLVDREKVQA
ncbi:MAG TPA: hypothetical protein VJ802_16155 [Gemmatimonadaceae bacterium]|nr:hypothetical protein [Gemmatimonadaceae bacterium]